VHELSLCRSIVGVVERHADTARVRRVNLQVGQLRQVVPATLTYCWSLVNADTPLGGSELCIESVPARIRCTGCAGTTELDAPVLVCAHCGGTAVQVVAGEEFLITSLELTEA